MTTLLKCTECGKYTFYEKRCCLECGNDSWVECDPGSGELLAVTTVHISPEGVPEPNLLGLAQFENGVNLVGQLESDLTVGESVELDPGRTLRSSEDGIHTGPRFISAKK